jgi:predicted DNA binding CopG/RHH family protein
MKKAKQINSTYVKLTDDQAALFVEDFRRTVFGQDQKAKAISLRVPENILNAFRLKAQSKGQKYQSAIVELMRQWTLKK